MPVRKIRNVDFTQERAGSIASAIQIGVAANTLATSANTLATTANTLATTANTLATTANTLAISANTAAAAITDWSVVNSTFTAVKNRSYFTNTASGSITAILPLNETLSIGDFVTFSDVAGTWSTNSLLIIQNIDSETFTSIAGNNFGHRMSTRNGSITLTYTGSNTSGFVVTESANTANVLTVDPTSFPPGPTGQTLYTTAGTYTFIAPTKVTSVSVVAIGAGAAGTSWGWTGGQGKGGGGGGLGWKNNIPVTPGQSYTVVVGAGPAADLEGGNSYFIDVNTVRGGGGGWSEAGNTASPGTYTGDGGGNGGAGGMYTNSYTEGGGGGAGGYSGDGGRGGTGARDGTGEGGAAGSGGGGGGGGGQQYHGGGGGGGVSVFGQGNSGAAVGFGGAGNGGSNGINGGGGDFHGNGGRGGFHGGGGGGRGQNSGSPVAGPGANGAVRIIWGGGRSYPFNVANT